MKAPDIRYECPITLDDALQQLSSTEQDCQPLAGGQSLMPMMHLRLARPEVLVDLNKLSELDFIDDQQSDVVIGAMVRYSTLASSAIIRDRVPLITKAIPHIAHAAIRNRGTIGGSAALADPAAEMPALLIALNATIIAISSQARREIAAEDFFLGIYETALEPGELIHSISIPAATPEQRFGFYELARRHGDYAMAGVAISAQSIDPYAGLQIVLFSVGDHALRAKDAENSLNGAMYNDVGALQRSKDALASLELNEDMNASADTKAHLAGVVLHRALQSMAQESLS